MISISTQNSVVARVDQNDKRKCPNVSRVKHLTLASGDQKTSGRWVLFQIHVNTVNQHISGSLSKLAGFVCSSKYTCKFFVMVTILGVMGWPVMGAAVIPPVQGQAPAQGDLENPDPNPANPTILPAQTTMAFSGVVTKLGTRPNGNPAPLAWHEWRIELIHPNGTKMIYPGNPVASTAVHTPISVVNDPAGTGKLIFGGVCTKLGGGLWDAGVYTMEFQARHRKSPNGPWTAWETIDTGKLTVAAPGGGAPGGGVN